MLFQKSIVHCILWNNQKVGIYQNNDKRLAHPSAHLEMLFKPMQIQRSDRNDFYRYRWYVVSRSYFATSGSHDFC
jgi:hypothetical protein